MKKIVILLVLILVFFSCKTTYVSTTTGLENDAHIKVVKANSAKDSYTNPLTLIIDGQEFTLSKIYADKKSMKAETTPTTPGKHHIVIKEKELLIFEKSLFIDNRETRKIILE